MVEAWLGRLPGVASAHQGTIKSQQLPNVQPRPSAHGERVHGAHSRTESIAETLGKTAGVPPVDPILLPHLSYPLPPPISPKFSQLWSKSILVPSQVVQASVTSLPTS